MKRTTPIDGSKLHECRISRSWSQEDLAEVVGVSVKTIQRAEGSARVEVRTLNDLADAVGVHPDALLPRSPAAAVPASAAYHRYDTLAVMLRERALEITRKLRDLRAQLDDVEEVPDGDPEKQCVREFVQGLDFALLEMKSRTLARINEALRRLDEGTYGVCADCGDAIGVARLQALPFADRCRECQASREEIAAASRAATRWSTPVSGSQDSA